ncbi:MAG: 2-hydroxyacid dehydrogenase [Alphaproteobacteria bacterium]
MRERNADVTKPDILLVGPFPEGVMLALENAYVLHNLWEANDKAGFLAERASIIRGIATTGSLGADRDLIEALPVAEIIACFGVGVDKIDLDYARERGVVVTNTPDVLTNDVADMGLVLMLALARRIPQGDVFVRSGQWLKGKMDLTTSVAGKTLGILGLGRIGRAVAGRAQACQMKIAYHDIIVHEDVDYTHYASPNDLAVAADILMVCLSGSATTAKLVNAEVFKALGPKGLFVNISRGMTVDEPALVAAVQNGTIAGAALDVFADEPNVPEALLSADNVVLQPHHASGTQETRAAMGDLVIENLRCHFAGETPPTPVLPAS